MIAPGSDPAVSELFVAAMRGVASTVCVITSASAGDPRGMTATAVMPLSVNPPTLALAVNRAASLNPLLGEGDRLTIQVLAEEQRELAAAFAGGLPPERRFFQGWWSADAWGVPVLEDAAATFSGIVTQRVELASHSLLIVEVSAVRSRSQAQPLLYADGDYSGLADDGRIRAA